jgi:membrane protein DedA with SNARE-associated domain
MAELLDSLWQSVLALSPLALYAIIFLLVALECSAFIGILIPGETALILGGFATAQGSITLPTLIIIASLAAIIGDSIGYWLGHAKGTRWALRYGHRLGVTKERFDRAQRLIKRHGGPAVFLGRFTSVARAFVPFVAGTGKLRYRTFLLYNVPGAVLWASVHAAIGYTVGDQWERFSKGAGLIGLLLAVFLITGAILLYRRARLYDEI